MNIAPTFDSWVTCPQPNLRANLRLFCFPYAGGGAANFRPWLDSLPIAVEVCPIELPGRGCRWMSPPFTELSSVVKAIAIALEPHLNKPFAFFGHSMGAILCFEVARILRKKYRYGPVRLFVSGRCAPQIPDRDPPIHALPKPDFIEELRRYNGTPEAVLQNAELMELVLPILRADFAVIENYVYSPEPPLECPITVFGGLHDRRVTCDELEGWRQQTLTSFSVQMFPGDHFFINSAHFLQNLSCELQQLTSINYEGRKYNYSVHPECPL